MTNKVKNKIKSIANTTFYGMLISIILAFIFVIATYLFYKIFIPGMNSYTADAITAFMGAFFAFLFVRIADFFIKYYERIKKHYNALIQLEQYLNKNFLLIAHNIFVIEDYKKTLDKAKQDNVFAVNPHILKVFPIEDDIMLKVLSVDLVNELFKYFRDLRSLNNDFEANNRFYEKMERLAIEKNQLNLYISSLEDMLNRLNVIKKFLIDLKNKTTYLFAYENILSQKKPWATRVIFFLSRNYSKIKKEEISNQIKKVEKELEKNKKEHEEEIKSIDI